MILLANYYFSAYFYRYILIESANPNEIEIIAASHNIRQFLMKDLYFILTDVAYLSQDKDSYCFLYCNMGSYCSVSPKGAIDRQGCLPSGVSFS